MVVLATEKVTRKSLTEDDQRGWSRSRCTSWTSAPWPARKRAGLMEEIAQVYSRALFEAARSGQARRVHEQFGEFTDAMDGEHDLQVFFFSPYFSTQEKQDGLERAVDGADELLLNSCGC